MTDRVWILGASDPEMELIEQLLRECGEAIAYATNEIPAAARRAYLVGCDVPTPERVERVMIERHRPGDFEDSILGQAIRLLGQVAEYPDSWERVAVSRHPHWCGAIERQGDRFVVRTVTRDGDPGEGDDEATACVIPHELVLAAVAPQGEAGA